MSEGEHKLRLGEILIDQGCIRPEDVDDALSVQARPGESRLLGQILLSRGHVKRHHIDIALAKQRALQREK